VESVYAELDRRRPGDAAVDDDAFVRLRHASGVRAHLWASAAAAQPGPRFRVMGARAAYVKWGLDPQEAALAAGARPGQPGWGREPEARWGALGTDGGAGGDAPHPVPTEPGGYEQFYAGVLAAVRGEAAPPVDPADAVAGLAVIEAARQSAAERRVVAVAATPRATGG
jgi:predicted dehydrogenase